MLVKFNYSPGPHSVWVLLGLHFSGLPAVVVAAYNGRNLFSTAERVSVIKAPIGGKKKISKCGVILRSVSEFVFAFFFLFSIVSDDSGKNSGNLHTN